MNAPYQIGALVRARGREWVVLPESTDEFILLRPLGGTEDEVTGILTALETVEPAQFDLPDPNRVGDHRSCRLLRDAVRLGFRSSAGPFRSFARLAVEPRPYQLVPLLMALKLDPIRLLIADDVGIGKTIEAALIARELLDRGEISRIAVLCPPALVEQWQAELSEKFHIEAELVLPSTATQLERRSGARLGESIFDLYQHVIVSTDFIKSDRRREEFLRTCPEFVIVDEAHTCVSGGEGRGGRHQRYQLISGLSADPKRHMVFVTATPHSGNESAFRSLLGLLNPVFAQMPDDLGGEQRAGYRKQLSAHLVQRRRGDIRAYMDAETPFPQREDREDAYKLSAGYQHLFERVLRYTRETVQEQNSPLHTRRVRWWSALALLRSLASSPAAAISTLRNRAVTADAETLEDVETVGRRSVLDLSESESVEGTDIAPGADAGDLLPNSEKDRKRLLDMAREAEHLLGAEDYKLMRVVDLTRDLLRDGYNPIIFCRFIPTVEYLVAELRGRLRNVEIVGVTGALPPAEREARVLSAANFPHRVLVCTDCLSEGVNLQSHFDSIIHYDLSWNPTRHEQREGRVDRYGQPRPTIRILTYYGIDNQIDGIVLDVLLRKHRAIRDSLGISVPVPVDTDRVIEAIFEGLLLREESDTISQPMLTGFDDFFRPQKDQLYRDWEAAEHRERRSRTLFAQGSIKVEEVARELSEAKSAIGSGVDVASFVRDAVAYHQGTVEGNDPIDVKLTSEAPRALREALGNQSHFVARFELPLRDGQLYLNRTHPMVEGLAQYVMNVALDPLLSETSPAKRCGAIRTTAVTKRTTVLLVRFRYHLTYTYRNEPRQLLAEECVLAAFSGSVENAEWLDLQTAEALLDAQAEEIIVPGQATDFVRKITQKIDLLVPKLETLAFERADILRESHTRVRASANLPNARYKVEPHLPPDILGIYVYLPALGRI